MLQEMSSGEDVSLSQYIDKIGEKLGQFNVDYISIRHLREQKSNFEEQVKYLEFVIASDSFCNESATVQQKYKDLRLKLRVDIVLIEKKIKDCPTPELLDENSDDEASR